MAQVRLSRFFQMEALATVSDSSLAALLQPFEDSLSGVIEAIKGDDDASVVVDRKRLRLILFEQAEKVDTQLVHQLSVIDELSTPSSMNTLLECLWQDDPDVWSDENNSPADIAVRSWIKDRHQTLKVYRELLIGKRRQYTCFVRVGQKPKVKPVLPTNVSLRRGLEPRLEKLALGKFCFVESMVQGDVHWYMVARGGGVCREGTHSDEDAGGLIVYRPRLYDLIQLRKDATELHINCGRSAKLRNAYRETLGILMFGNPDSWPPFATVYSLDPLAEDVEKSLRCADVEGLSEVILTEVQYLGNKTDGERIIHRAKDLSAMLKRASKAVLPDWGKPVSAKFKFTFGSDEAPRIATIRPPNELVFARDNDIETVEKWLTRRGFVARTKEAK